MNAGRETSGWLESVGMAACTVVLASIFAITPAALELAQHVTSAWQYTAQQFEVVNASTPVTQILLPTIFFGLLTLGIMALNPRRGRLARAAVITMLVALYTTYMAFRLFATLNLSSPASAVFSILFFLAESVIYLKSLSAYLQMFWPTDRSAQADLLMKDVVSGKYQPSVDIFVPTYSEPVEILRRTILGCQNVAYENKNIYLLDDQRRPEMKALAAELGCHYRDRPDNRDAKAGNMNAALPSSDGDLIAVFDADFVPTADFLMRTVGFFQDEKVGLVQTPQNFYSVDAVSRNLGLPRVLTEEQQVFFRSAQPGRDTLGAMICHGTSFVVRRSAVERIGTFPGETLSEDWATSIKLQSAGYRTYYLNELLSAGAAAEFVTEFVTQRLRWARGTMQCFYASTNPFTVPGLKWWQRLVHLSGPLHYIQYSCRLFCLLLPLVYLLFGIVPVDVSGELLLVFLLPYWVCQTLSLSWLTGGHRSAFWSEVYETMLCVPMTATVISTLIRPFGKPFKVSGKGKTREKLSFNLVLGTPLILFLLLYAMTLSYAVMNASWYPSQSIFALAIGWAVYSMVLIWLSLQAFMDVPQSSARLSFAHRLPAVLWCNGKPVPVTTQEISEYDAVVTVPEVPLETGARGAVLKLELPLQGVEPFRVVNVEVNARAGGWRIEWQHPVPQQHRLLVAHLFGRPGQWDGRGVPEHVTFWHFLQAPFRMHALAETN